MKEIATQTGLAPFGTQAVEATPAPPATTSAPVAGTPAAVAGTSVPIAGTSGSVAGTPPPVAATPAAVAGTPAPIAGTSTRIAGHQPAAAAALSTGAAARGTPPDAAASARQASVVLAEVRFDANGLVPAIAQQHDTGEVLMMAWMNAEAVRETLATGRVCYFSRSRGKLWRKGETSGQAQHLKELRVDCDGDTLLLLVHQEGVACHTGRRNCFFRAARDGGLVEIAAPTISPEALYGHTHG